jgi:hypothetical protein
MISRFFEKYFFRYIKGQSGIAALMGAVITIVVLGTVALNFWVESKHKHAGSALTRTSTNAFFIAESGIRYVEGCLIKDPTNTSCWCNQGSSSCSTWATVPDITTPIPISGGAFTVAFSSKTSSSVRANSIGTFRMGERIIGKTISLAGGCAFTTNSVSACTSINILNNAETDASTGLVSCELPLVAAVTVDGAGCPNATYPDYDTATHVVSGELNHFQFCNFTIDGSDTFTISSDRTIEVENDLIVKQQSSIKIRNNAKVTFKVEGKITIEGNADFDVNDSSNQAGTLTLHNNDDFKLQNTAKINQVYGLNQSPIIGVEDVIVLAGKNATIENSTVYVGGLVANDDINIQNNNDSYGAILGDNVTLENNSNLTYGSLAGSEAEGYDQCQGGSGSEQLPPDYSG